MTTQQKTALITGIKRRAPDFVGVAPSRRRLFESGQTALHSQRGRSSHRGHPCKAVSVFGSMALDDRRGGDIDLFFETDNPLPNRANAICQLSGALTLALGDRKIDVLLKDANTPPAPIFEIAKRTGVPL